MLNIDSQLLRQLIPNLADDSQFDDEPRLIDKLAPYLAHQEAWLVQNILSPDIRLSPQHALIAQRFIASSAMADAVPALDLIMTSAGFAVISTDGRVPASAERVRSFVASLRSTADSSLVLLVDILHRFYHQWHGVSQSSLFKSTLFPSMQMALPLRRNGECVFDAYRRLVQFSGEFSRMAAQYVVGRRVMDQILALALRQVSTNIGSDSEASVLAEAQNAALEFVRARSEDKSTAIAWDAVLKLCQRLVFEIKYCPALSELFALDVGRASGMVQSKGGMFL